MMLAENDAFHRSLRGMIAHRFQAYSFLADDLFQEAMMHLLRIEPAHPDKPEWWYLKSCRLHLCDYLKAGRSLDSPKRAANGIPGPRYYGDGRPLLEELVDESESGAVVENVSVHDAATTLLWRLHPRDRPVFARLMRGSRVTEVAAELCVSHTRVWKSCRRIAQVARSVGITTRREAR